MLSKNVSAEVINCALLLHNSMLASPEIQSEYLDEILLPSSLSILIADKFGNYVIQTALDVLRRDLRKRLVEALTGLLPILHQSDVGLKIIGKMRSA